MANLNFYNYKIASINDELKPVNILYDKPVKNNIVDKTLMDKNLSNSLTVYYPLESTCEKYPLVAFVHGWGCDKKMVTSMARFVAHSGFVTVAVSVKKWQYPENWLPALESAFSIIENYSKEKTSPLYNKIDFSRTALVGHSMGGTGVLHYANRNPEVDTVIALHPYNGGKGIVSAVGGENEVLGENLKNQNAYTLIFTGNKDTIALPDKTYKFFENLNFSKSFEQGVLPRGSFFMLDNAKHDYPIEVISNIFKNKKKEYAYNVYILLVRYYLLATLKNETHFAEVFLPESSEFENLKQVLGTYKAVPSYDYKW